MKAMKLSLLAAACMVAGLVRSEQVLVEQPLTKEWAKVYDGVLGLSEVSLDSENDYGTLQGSYFSASSRQNLRYHPYFVDRKESSLEVQFQVLDAGNLKVVFVEFKVDGSSLYAKATKAAYLGNFAAGTKDFRTEKENGSVAVKDGYTGYGIKSFTFTYTPMAALNVVGDPIEPGQPGPNGWGINGDLVPGTEYTFTAPADGEDTVAGVRWTCTGWTFVDTDGVETSGDGSSFKFTYQKSGTLTWRFNASYRVVATAGDGGRIADGCSEQWINLGSAVTVTAVPASGRSFYRWNGDVPDNNRFDNPLSVVVTEPMTVSASFAKSVYVASDRGSDTEGDGSSDAPYATIVKGLSEAADGDTVRVSTGNYSLTVGLVLDKPVTVCSDSGVASDVKILRNTSKDKFHLVTLKHADAVLRNVTVQDGSWSANYATGANVYITGDGGLVEGCVIRNGYVGGWSSRGGGVAIESAGGILSRCRVEGNQANEEMAGAGLYMTAGLAVNTLFVGNVNNSSSAKGVVHLTGGTLLNCTVAGNTSKGVGGVTATGTSVVKNCLIADNVQTGVADPTTAVYSGTAANFVSCVAPIYINDMCTEGKTVFKSLATGDCRLMLGSAAIDAGTADDRYGTTDFSGAVRVSGAKVDAGCCEFDSTAAHVTLEAPVLSGTYPLSVTFTLQASGCDGVASYGWDFDGDGEVDETTEVPTTSHDYATYTTGMSPSVTLFDAGGTALAASENALQVTTYPKTLFVDGNSKSAAIPYDSETTAAKTIADALAVAKAGSTIVIKANTYKISTLLVDKAVTLVGATGKPEDVVLTPNGNVKRAVTLSHPQAKLLSVTVSGFTYSTGNYDHGRAICIDTAGGTVSNCVIRNCKAVGYANLGGGIYMLGVGLVTHTVITNCQTSTYGAGGSAVYMTDGEVRNCLFAGNSYPSTETGTAEGGTVYMTGGKVENCTLALNSSRRCAGIWCKGGSVANCIMAQGTTSSSTETEKAWAGTAAKFSHCITDTADPINSNCATGSSLFVSAKIGDFHLSTGCEALDFGEELGWMTEGATDLDGQPRIDGDHPDAGCYEAKAGVFAASFRALSATEAFAPITVDFEVNVENDGGEGVTCRWYDGDAAEPFATSDELSLRFVRTDFGTSNIRLVVEDKATGASFEVPGFVPVYAAPKTLYVVTSGDTTVTSAHPYGSWATAAKSIPSAYGAALPGATIVLTNGTHYLSSQLVIAKDKPVTIVGAGERPEDAIVKVSSNNSLFYLGDAQATLVNLTLDAKQRGGGNPPSSAGLVNNYAGGTVSNCILRNSYCGNWGGYGAAVYMRAGVLSHCVISNCTVDGNISGASSKEDAKGVAVHMVSGRMENCFLSDNRVADRAKTESSLNGGAVYLKDGQVVNCTVIGNSHPGCAGVYADGGTVANCLIVGNESYVSGGAASVWRGTADCFTHCLGEIKINDDCQIGSTEVFKPTKMAKGVYVPLGKSAARDAGDNAFVGETTDLYGKPRVFGGLVDIGCAESQTGGLNIYMR